MTNLNHLLPRNLISKLDEIEVIDINKLKNELQDPKHTFTLELSFDIDEDLPWFNGHFPNLKILPGVAQINSINAILQYWLNKQFNMVTLPKFKFQNVIRPNDKIFISLNYKLALNTVDFTITKKIHDHNEKSICCSGKIKS